MKSPARWFLLTLATTFLAGTTGLDAKTKTLHYPTEDESMFFITAPADWEVTGIDEVGEFGSIESENGSILQFRAVECETEEEFMAEMASITESTIETLEENYSDVRLGEVKELDVNGRRGFQLSGEGKDEDGDPVQFGSFTIILGPTTIAEVWAAAYPEDKAVAEAVLNSFSPTGAPAGALNLDFELVNKTGYAIKEIYVSPAAADVWQDNVLSKPMADGQSLDITFDPEADATMWDMKIVWVDEGEDVQWKGFNLAETSKITLYYDADTDETTADVE
jgi:hypothetical protein